MNLAKVTRPRAYRAIATGLLAALITLLTLHAVGVGIDMVAAIRYPLQLNYGEGIVWQQGIRIPGPLMYATSTTLPFIVFHYPPVYYLLVRAAQWLQPDYLVAGRTVAALSTASLPPLIAALVLAATHRRAFPQTPPRIIALSATAGLVVLCLHAVHSWGLIARVDMPGFALALAGLLAATRADGRFWGTTVALLLCAAAVFTKQTLLPAGAAVFVVACLRRPAPALAAALLVALLCVAAVAGLQHATAGGFLQNVIGNNINRLSLDQALHVLSNERQSLPAMAVMAAAGLWTLWTLAPSLFRLRPGAALSEVASLRRADPALAARAMLVLYFAFATLFLFTLFKVGGWVNYLIDWFCAGGILMGVMLVDLDRRYAQPGLIAALTVLLLGVQLSPLRLIPDAAEPAAIAAQRRAVALIRAADRPVASEDMTLLMRAGKEVTFEPSIVTELASVGRWDETPLVQMIRNGGFAFILSATGPDWYIDRRTPAVTAAIRQSYPNVQQLGPDIWIRTR